MELCSAAHEDRMRLDICIYGMLIYIHIMYIYARSCAVLEFVRLVNEVFSLFRIFSMSILACNVYVRNCLVFVLLCCDIICILYIYILHYNREMKSRFNQINVYIYNCNVRASCYFL